jgi:arginine decarboxylase
MIFANRIPYEYFLTKGSGESNVASKGFPYETGSYDQALNVAGIQNANVIEYTSVIPTGAKEITREEGLSRIQWGEVMECIKAQANGPKGSFISAAVMTTSVYDPSGKYLGALACEYSDSGDQKACEKSLTESIVGIIERRGFGSILGECKMYIDNGNGTTLTHTINTKHSSQLYTIEHKLVKVLLNNRFDYAAN